MMDQMRIQADGLVDEGIQRKNVNGHLDTIRQSFDTLLDNTRRLPLVVQETKAAQVRAFGEPASAGLWPVQQSRIEDGIAQGSDVHFEYDLVLELPPCVVIDHGGAIMARRHAPGNKRRVIESLSESFPSGSMEREEIEYGLGPESLEVLTVLRSVNIIGERLGGRKFSF
jgi:hypothetical protein